MPYNELLWHPSRSRTTNSYMTRFTTWVGDRIGRSLGGYDDLHSWSVSDIASFWRLFLEFSDIQYSGEVESVVSDRSMPGARWFEGTRVSLTRNVFERGYRGPAIVYRVENRNPDDPAKTTGGEITFAELESMVARCARGLHTAGLKAGDRVGGFVANVPEAIVAMLACASMGITWASASPDFGPGAVRDRFGQVRPRLIFASTHYRYKGRTFSTGDTVSRFRELIPDLETVVSVPYPVGEAEIAGDMDWARFLGDDDSPALESEDVPFDHPLYIMFSSGTTGAPKCMVHGTGGTLLQHRKEHLLHCDLHPGERLLYFTTCGWMMWNWLASALASGVTIVLYDGNPAFPDLRSMWQVVCETGTTHFGTSGRHIESCLKGLRADDLAGLQGLPDLRTVLYTGSPLSEAGFRWVYEHVKQDVHLAGIAGGTDIISCFVLGNPNLPVRAGRVQCKGLGVDVAAFDPEGIEIVGTPGELVCRQPMPSMPVEFLNDPDGQRYLRAYFEHYPGVWRHGDWVTFTDAGECIIHGRSDATLNPGGVRIGSSEIYSALDTIPDISGSVAVGWKPPAESDEIVILLVVVRDGKPLDSATETRIRNSIREACSPRHVPKHLFRIEEVPVTRSGKKVELTVKSILAGEDITNRDAVANPLALQEIERVRDLLQDLYGSRS